MKWDWRKIKRINWNPSFRVKLIFGMSIGFVFLLVIPAGLVWLSKDSSAVVAVEGKLQKKQQSEQKKEKVEKIPTSSNLSTPEVRVYLTKEKRLVSLPIEDYIEGVIASEMPIDFHLEALKAQAMAARTYIVNRLQQDAVANLKQYGGKAAKLRAHVTDTVQYQVYSTDEQLKKRWGIQYETNKAKVHQAVTETKGKILVYKNKPIYAAFFSTSNGRTENAEEYFQSKVPYLKSVNSAWDKASPKYERKVTYTTAEIITKIEKYTKKQITIPVFTNEAGLQITKKTTGNRIASIRVGDVQLSGREMREALGLASSDFTWKKAGNKVTFTTYGFGHGVGMSQWGANIMAQYGKRAEEIVKHYYQGIRIMQMKS